MNKARSVLRIPLRGPWLDPARVATVLLGTVLLVGCPAQEPGPRDEPSDERPVRIALHGDPATLDPHLQSEVIAQAVLGNVFEGLVAFDGRMRVVPQLATSWSNPDEQTWRFTLREGVAFHDGSALDADDVVFSLERVRRHPRSRQAGSLVAVEEVVAVDEQTVEIRTNAAYSVLLSKLAFVSIVPEGAADEILAPVGSGPYRFVEHLGTSPIAGVDGGVLALERVPHWRGDDVPARIEYHFASDRDVRVDGLLAGTFDLIDDLGREATERLEGRADLRIESLSSIGVDYLQLGVTVPPFDDPRVRRAIHLAVDRTALAEAVYGPYAEPAGQMVSQNVFGYAPDLEPPERDLDQVRALLAAAGFPDGLTLDLEYREGRPGVSELVTQLESAGFEIKATARPWSVMYQRLQAGDVGFYVGGWICTSGDAGDLFDAKVHTPDQALGYGKANYIGYSHPTLDVLIEEANRAGSMEQRGELWRDGLHMLDEDLPLVPLLSPYEVYGVRQRIRWTPRQDGRVYGFDIRLETGSGPPRER